MARDDSRVSAITAAAAATDSPWPTFFAALIGAGAALTVGFVTQLLTGRREKKEREEQWQLERDNRQEQWQQEHQARREQWMREDLLRWKPDILQTCLYLVTALDEWAEALRLAVSVRTMDAPLPSQMYRELDMAELGSRERAVRKTSSHSSSWLRRLLVAGLTLSYSPSPISSNPTSPQSRSMPSAFRLPARAWKAAETNCCISCGKA